MSPQAIFTLLIVVGVIGVILIEYGITRFKPVLDSLGNSITIGKADTGVDKPVDVATLATQFASVRAQIEKTEGITAAEAFVSTYANSIFKSELSK